MKLVPYVCLLAALPSLALAQTCPSYNAPFSDLQNPTDGTQHSTGFHQGILQVSGSCAYGYQAGTNDCTVKCSATVTGGATDQGAVSLGYQHQANYSPTMGNAASNGPAVTCGGQVAAAVRSCYAINPSCDITVTISAGANGLGGSASYSATPIWSPTITFPYTCGSRISHATTCNPTYPAPINHYAGYVYVWNYSSCSWVLEPCPDGQCNSPILIDTEGSGFQLSAAKDGVVFDFYGDGSPIRVAWPTTGSKNGWLALPRDGKVTSARDLFGNLTGRVATIPRVPPAEGAPGPSHLGTGDFRKTQPTGTSRPRFP